MKTLQLSLVTLIASAVGAWAASTGPARIHGVVVDSKKNPVAGAEVHITAKDGSGLQKIARTDGGGQYGVSGLPVTDYEVVLIVNREIKASLTNQHVFGDKPTKVDFKLTGQYAAAAAAGKKHTHMVYVPAETGSNLSGHWVEVDDVTGAGAASGEVKHLSGAAVRQMQSHGTAGSGN